MDPGRRDVRVLSRVGFGGGEEASGGKEGCGSGGGAVKGIARK